MDKVVAPNCTDMGYTVHTCQKCGHSYTDGEVAALGHDYTHTVTAPTCTAPGHTDHKCNRCGHSYTDGATAALGHSYVSVITPPTSKEQGYTTHTCQNCGHSYMDSYTDPVKNTITVTVTKTYAKITTAAVNVRNGAGASFTRVGRLYRGDRVEILAQKNVDGKIWGRYEDGWFRITGYATLETVTETYEVEVEEPVNPENPENPENPVEPEKPVEPEQPSVPDYETEIVTKTYATITAAAVNVRKGAGASFAWAASLHRGDKVEILEQKDVEDYSPYCI